MENKKLLMFGMMTLALFMSIMSVGAVQEPNLRTGEVKDLNSQSVVLTGELVDLGGAPEYNVSFDYRKEIETNWTTTDSILLDVETTTQKYVNNLTDDTSYQYRIKAVENGEEYYGAVRTFTTEPKETIFYVNFDKDSNTYIFLGVLALGLIGIYIGGGLALMGSLIYIIGGFILMLSGVNLLIGLIVLFLGIIFSLSPNLSHIVKGGTE